VTLARVSSSPRRLRCALGSAALLAGSLAVPAAPGRAAAPDDPLWLRAVEIAGRNEHWVPGTIVTRIEELDGEGRAKHVRESSMRLFLGEGGEVESEILRAAEDGKDTTEKERRSSVEEKKRAERERAAQRERLEKKARERGVDAETLEREEARGGRSGRKRGSSRFGGPTPFDPAVQDSVSARRVSAEDPPAGGPHIAFEFTQQVGATGALRGIAWIEETTGLPIELRFAPDPLPGRVKEMSLRVRFAAVADTAWVPVDMEVHALGKMLLFKKRYRSSLSFADHWWKEGE